MNLVLKLKNCNYYANNSMSLFEFDITVCKMKTFDEIDG